MPIPTKQDYQLAEIDNLHGAVLVKLRVWQRGTQREVEAESIRRLVQAYADAAVDFLNGTRR